MRRESQLEGHVISVLGLKGGVGKTTLAVNLGVGLAYAHPESRVVVVDSNPLNGDVGPMLNMRGPNSIVELASLVRAGESLDLADIEQVMVKHESGLRLLLAPHYTQYNAESHAFAAEAMHSVLKELKNHYHYVIVDTSPAFDKTLAACIEEADVILLVTTPSVLALKDTKILLNELENAGYHIEDTVLVVNQHRPDGTIKAAHIQNFLQHEVNAEIPWDPYADQAINRAVPLITLSSKKAPSPLAMRNLVKFMAEKYPPPVATVYAPGALGTRQLRPPYVHPQRPYISVMIVDDQENMREMTTVFLEIGQEQVTSKIKIDGQATNGKEAVEMVDKLIPDVILMDINMPEMDGLQATRRILNRYPSIAIIVVTVHESPEYWREAIRLGVADYIPKTTLGPHIAGSVEEVYNRYIPIRARFQAG